MDITRACEHISTIKTEGLAPYEIQEKRAYFEKTKCPKCDPKLQRKREAENKKYRDEQNQKYIAVEQRMGLSELQGSVKQIPYGRRCRVDLLVAAFDELGLSEQEFTERITNQAAQVGSAGWWIDHRELPLDQLEETLNAALGTTETSPRDITENPF